MRNKILYTSLLLAVLLAGAPFGRAADDPDRDAFERGGEAYERGNYRLAIEEYRQCLATFGPRYAEAHYNIGVCFHELGQTKEAITWYRAAIKARRGRYPMAHFALGVALEEMGRREEGKAAFNEAIEASGDIGRGVQELVPENGGGLVPGLAKDAR